MVTRWQVQSYLHTLQKHLKELLVDAVQDLQSVIAVLNQTIDEKSTAAARSAYPVNSIYFSSVSDNPADSLRYGEWKFLGKLTVGGTDVRLWSRLK